MQQTGKKVAVTGANGFVASQIVKKLLEKGYKVVGTVRNPQDSQKVSHLKTLPNASESLNLVQASLDDEQNNFISAFQGCECVFHVASPVFFKGSENDIVVPALKGTEKVLQGIEDNKSTVKNLIYTSSMASVKTGIKFDKPVDKNTWSNEEFMRNNERWYALSKTLAEKSVVDFCQKRASWLKFATVCPTVVQGPALSQSIQNFTLQSCVSDIVKGDLYSVGEMMFYNIVDVRDVADLHINAYEQNVDGGRYLAIGDSYDIEIYGQILKKVCQEEGVEEKITIQKPGENSDLFKYNYDNSESVQLLGKEFYKLEECLRETVRSIKGVYI